MLSTVSHCIFIMLKWVTLCHNLQTYLKLLDVEEGRSIQGLLLSRASSGRSYCSNCKDKWDCLRKPSVIFPWDGQVAARGGCSPKEGERRAATRQASQCGLSSSTQSHGTRGRSAEQSGDRSRSFWHCGECQVKEEITCQVEGEFRKPKQWFRYRARGERT